MIFCPTELPGAWLIEPELVSDERGSFARTWCAAEFEDRGLNSRLAQCNISINRKQGTVRGMHLQREPHAEAKLVRCTRGAIYDVLVDLRPESPTFRHWIARELSDDNHRMVYIPEGVAHGFQSLTDHAEVYYQMSREYHPESAFGFRWNDTVIAIQWPLLPQCISSRDLTWQDLSDDRSARTSVAHSPHRTLSSFSERFHQAAIRQGNDK